MPPQLKIATTDRPDVPAEVATVIIPMDAAKARALTERMRQNQTDFWVDFCEVVNREGYKALGFETVKEYAHKELQLSDKTLRRRLAELDVEQALGLPLGSLPERQARELASLPDPGTRREAFEAAREKAAADGTEVSHRHVVAARKEVESNGTPHATDAAIAEMGGDEDETRSHGTNGESEPEPESAPVPESELSDDEWLAERTSEKVRGMLPDLLRAGYDRDALLYRSLMKHKEALAGSFRLHARANAPGVKAGLYLLVVQRFLRTPHPATWLVCHTCQGAGGTGGNCYDCKGRGYVFPS